MKNNPINPIEEHLDPREESDITSLRLELARRAQERKLLMEAAGLNSDGKSPVELTNIHRMSDRYTGPPMEIIDHPKLVKVVPDRDPAQDFYNALRSYFRQMQADLKKNQQLIVCHYNERGEETKIWHIALKSPDLLALIADDRIILAHVNSLQITVRIQELEKPEVKRPIKFSPVEP